MSTIKSSADHLTINADGASKDIKFQANGVEKASISSAGAFTSTTIDATVLTGALPAISGANLTSLPGGGKVLQVVQTVLSSSVTLTANGTETAISGLSVAITPSLSSSKVLIEGHISYGAVGTTYKAILKRGSTTIGAGDAAGSRQVGITGLGLEDDANQTHSASFIYLDSSPGGDGSTSITYSINVNNDNNVILYINRSKTDTNGAVGGRLISTITATEIGA